MLLDAVGAFGIVVGGSAWMLLRGERNNYGCVVEARGGKLVGLIPCPNFEPRPLAPGVDAGCGLNHVGDVGAADAGGDFDEIEFAAGVRPQELRMGHSAYETEALDQTAIDFEERCGFLRFTRKSARRKYPALVRGIER